jgi:hypothetical protein
MSLFNALRRALGVNAGDDLQDEEQISSFEQAGLTGDGTTGTVASATDVNTSALPPQVVQAQQVKQVVALLLHHLLLRESQVDKQEKALKQAQQEKVLSLHNLLQEAVVVPM